MMVADHLPDPDHRLEGFQNLGAKFGVSLHRFPFGGIQRAGLVQNSLGDAHFPDIVQQSRQANLFDLGMVETERLRQHHGVCGNLLGMALRVLVLRIDRKSEGGDRFDDGGRQNALGNIASLVHQRTSEQLEAAIDFVEGLRVRLKTAA